MGIFSSKKTISVSSTVYNLAGDEEDHVDFKKASLFGSVISNEDSISDDLRSTYFKGPGIKQRQFFQYTKRNELSSLPSSVLKNTIETDNSIIENEIPISPTPSNLTIFLLRKEFNNGDFEPWIEKWILENHPNRYNEDWLGDYDPITDVFSVEFPDNSFYSWSNNTTPIYSIEKDYLILKYIEFVNQSSSSIITGSENYNVTSLPDISGWDEDLLNVSSNAVTLQRNRTTTYSFSDGRPDEVFEDNVDVSISGSQNTSSSIYSREIIIQQNGFEFEGEKQIWNFTATDTITNDYSNTVITYTDIGGGVTRTETSVTDGEQINEQWTTRYDTQELYNGTIYGGEQIYIYEIGSGNLVLDSLLENVQIESVEEYFPFIPVRLNNVSILENQYESLFDESSKAYDKAFQDKSLRELVESVEDNESIGDIDYSYIMFGCPLNVKDNSSKKYLWKYFENMIPIQNSSNSIGDLNDIIALYNQEVEDYRNWYDNNPPNGEWGGTVNRPKFPVFNIPETSTVKIQNSNLGYDIRLQWVSINIQQFVGNYGSEFLSEESKPNEISLVNGPAFTWNESNYEPSESQTIQRTIPSLYIYWQITPTTYRRMQIWGLTHFNYIYGGKSVRITSTEALDDSDISGFIIPLHYPTLVQMSIVDYTQFSTTNSYILFNSYTVVKQKWYQSSIFKLILIVAIIVLSVFLFPGSYAAGGGLLGTNLSVGAALGLSGTAALIAGVVANYIAALVVSQILSSVSTELFGEKWGNIISLIATFAVGASISGIDIFSTKGLLQLSSSIANGYSGWVQAELDEYSSIFENENEKYEEQMDHIQELLNDLYNNNLGFNPIQLTDSDINSNGKGYIPETSDEYIRRTTMTASDIIELTHSMVYDFTNIMKTLPRN